MIKLNRKAGPGFRDINQIAIPNAQVITLDNDIKVYLIDLGSQELVKIDILLRGGRLLEKKMLESRFTSAMIREGNIKMSGRELAEFFDYHGATLRTGSSLVYNFLSLTTMSKFFETLLPVYSELYYEPTFPEEEIVNFKKILSDKLRLDMSKDEYVSYRLLTEAIYGSKHPYGYNTEQRYIAKIEREDILGYYRRAFVPKHTSLIVSGKFPKNIESTMNKYFGQSSSESSNLKVPRTAESLGTQRIERKAHSIHQTSLKIGRRLFDRFHPEFPVFYILNTILGGYFGSRLMTVIREQKGYTYNIYSMFDHLIKDGYFYISAEVGNEYLIDTVIEIYNQIEILQSVLVTDEELAMVKNYLMGSFLNLIDGPFNVASFYQNLLVDNYDIKDFQSFVEKLLSVTPGEIRDCARKYLCRENMIEVFVGNEPIFNNRHQRNN